MKKSIFAGAALLCAASLLGGCGAESHAETAVRAPKRPAESSAPERAESAAESVTSGPESLAEAVLSAPESLAEAVLSAPESFAETVLSEAEDTENPVEDPNNLALYIGLSFDDLKAQFPDIVENPTTQGSYGYSLGEPNEKGTGAEAGFTGSQAEDMIKQVNLFHGTTYNIFGITSGQRIQDAIVLAERAGLEQASDGSNGLYVFNEPTGGQMQIYTEDQKTVSTVSFSIEKAAYLNS